MADDSPRSPVTAGSSVVPATARVSFTPVEGAKELFTPQFVDYLVFLHERFTQQTQLLRQQLQGAQSVTSAERQIWAPRPGKSSTQWTSKPAGMCRRGIAFPTVGSTASVLLLRIAWPT